MYELNKHYGWSKFIVVVPSIAIREGVYKSFQVTQEHFAEEYGKKIRFFIYNSAQLTEIDRFASDSSINVMIINSQAFNAKGKDARRIYMKLDEFRSRRPIDIIAKTNPILIIDEPQSVEGKQTKERLKEFNPLLTLRYSATHKADSIYNMVYRLDAMEAYNKRLVKKIAVKGITESGSTATEGFVYLESINLSKADPTATIQFDCIGAKGLRKKTATVGIGYNLYDNSGESGKLDEYKEGFVVKSIDGRDNSVEFLNGIKIFGVARLLPPRHPQGVGCIAEVHHPEVYIEQQRNQHIHCHHTGRQQTLEDEHRVVGPVQQVQICRIERIIDRVCQHKSHQIAHSSGQQDKDQGHQHGVGVGIPHGCLGQPFRLGSVEAHRDPSHSHFICEDIISYR